jgi:putative transposase
MPSKKIKTPILPDKYYHVFNKANNEEKIFRDDSDYQFFLRKLCELVTQNVDIYTFCLLPNHFHLLIKPKPLLQDRGSKSINESLRKFFQIYVQYFNKKYERKGSLFLKSFRRIIVAEEFYLKLLVFYIHYNPQKHRVVADYRKYRYSSYRIFGLEKETHLQKKDVLYWFNDNLSDFENYHQDCLERKIMMNAWSGTPSLGMESLT